MFSSCAGTGGGGYWGTPFDSGSIIFGGYNEVPPSLRAGLAAWDHRVWLTTTIYRLIHGSPKGATADEIAKYRAAMADLLERILSRPQCAEFFGGVDSALGALSGTPVSVENLGGPNMRPDGSIQSTVAQTVDRHSIEINRQGGFFTGGLIQAGSFFYAGLQPVQLPNFGLQGADFAALFLGHELGHIVGVFGRNDNDKDQAANERNTQAVFDACFS
jgi:hypothetical protein